MPDLPATHRVVFLLAPVFTRAAAAMDPSNREMPTSVFGIRSLKGCVLELEFPHLLTYVCGLGFGDTDTFSLNEAAKMR